jgi:hypothetical protein
MTDTKRQIIKVEKTKVSDANDKKYSDLLDQMKYQAKKLFILMGILSQKLNISKFDDKIILHISQIIIDMFNRNEYTKIDMSKNGEENPISAIRKKLQMIQETSVNYKSNKNLNSIISMFQQINESFGKNHSDINLLAMEKILHSQDAIDISEFDTVCYVFV